MTRYLHSSGRASAGLLYAALAFGTVACADEPAPLFQIPETGAIEGLVFFDRDRDAGFDPSAGDVVLSNVRVRLLERGTAQVLAGGETQTDASGRFHLTGVPVGSHELAIDTVGVGAGVAFCQNPIPVTVFLRETLFQQVGARSGCVIIIADAEQLAAGSPATVRGAVVSSPGQIAAGRMYVQDNTSGIRLDNVNTGGATLAVGDVVEISGTFGFEEQETIIRNGTLADQVPGGTPPVPRLTTTRELADAGPAPADPLQGRLVVVRRAQVTTAWGNNTGSSRNAFINDGSGPTTIRIDSGTLFVSGTTADLIARLNEIMGLDRCYDIVGIATSFRGGGQIFPRTLSDITEVPCG